MDQKQLACLLTKVPGQTVMELAAQIEAHYPVRLLSGGAITLVVLEERPGPAGEHPGLWVNMSGDDQKARAAAVLDAAFAAGLPLVAELLPRLARLEEQYAGYPAIRGNTPVPVRILADSRRLDRQAGQAG